MDQRGTLPSRTELLHALTRTRGSTVGDLCWLASAQDLGWHRCRSSLYHPVYLYPLDTQLRLRGVWDHTLDCSDLLWLKTSRARDCRGRCDPYREPGD